MGSKVTFGFSLVLVLAVSSFLIGCGGGGLTATLGPAPSPSPTPVPTGLPVADHVFVIVLENHAFAQIVGSSSMPFLNSLATQHSLAANYFANTHPSIGNYFMLTTGNIQTNDDAFTGTVSSDNIAQALTTAGKTWRSYMESLPSAGYTGNDVYPYFKHHDPFTYMTGVLSTQTADIVPFSQLPNDLAAGTLPSFAFIAPNVEDDAHDCPGGGVLCTDDAKLAAADAWLNTNIGPLISSPALANSVFIITFDESLDIDVINGGGQVATVLVGSHVKSGFRSTTFYQHQSTLRLVLDLLRVSDHPGSSATAPAMDEFFQ
ncbi:MAG TPA: alkaline phosphatase family protein [Candidatus Angelobacter sp.]|jgi:acid phosphatase